MATRNEEVGPHADAWLKEVAPSTELRRRFAHRVGRWEDFRRLRVHVRRCTAARSGTDDGLPHALEARAALAKMCVRSRPPQEEAAIHDGRTG